tara:strand:+ start:16520 stop:17146 length:627 start_codon:yes stop_codon:yes gene_type:complete
LLESNSFHLFNKNGSIKAIPNEIDHFSLLGLPRKMNIDSSILEKVFFDLSKQLHPDFFQNANTTEKIRSLDATTRINEAKRVLGNRILRMIYLVELENGKLKENDSNPPADLLEEILEAQETAAELECCLEEDKAEELKKRVLAAKECFETFRKSQNEILEEYAKAWDERTEAQYLSDDELIQKIRLVLSLRNYIENILLSLDRAMGS